MGTSRPEARQGTKLRLSDLMLRCKQMLHGPAIDVAATSVRGMATVGPSYARGSDANAAASVPVSAIYMLSVQLCALSAGRERGWRFSPGPALE